MSNDTIAGSGLEKMFYGQILSILVIIPLVGWIAAIVGIVLFLVGLHEAAGADEGYRTAFYVEIGILVLSETPAVRSFGLVLSAGVLFAFLLAPATRLITRRNTYREERPR